MNPANVRLETYTKSKDVDICIFENDKPFYILSIRSQIQSIGKNITNNANGLRGEVISIKENCPGVKVGLVYLLNKTGLHYDTMATFDKFDLSKQVFFNAILFNFLCIVSTCVVIFSTAKKFLKNNLLAFTSGLIYLLGFGTLFYELMPITDALSILLFAVIVHGYLSKSYMIIFPLLLLIIQREYIFLALGLIAVIDLWKYREKYYLHILVSCVVCFIVYIVLRKTIFYTPKYDHQASAAFFFNSILKIKFPLGTYIRQTVMTLNIFLVYLALIIYKKYKKMKIDNFNLIKLVLLFLQINVISFAAVFGNNTGRYFYILIPIYIFQLAKESQPLLKETEE